jgi:hypothetical protein
MNNSSTKASKHRQSDKYYGNLTITKEQFAEVWIHLRCNQRTLEPVKEDIVALWLAIETRDTVPLEEAWNKAQSLIPGLFYAD